MRDPGHQVLTLTPVRVSNFARLTVQVVGGENTNDVVSMGIDCIEGSLTSILKGLSNHKNIHQTTRKNAFFSTENMRKLHSMDYQRDGNVLLAVASLHKGRKPVRSARPEIAFIHLKAGPLDNRL